MLPQSNRFVRGLSLAAIVLTATVSAFVLSGCGPTYDYPGYPSYGYAPYSWGWGNTWGYDPTFVVHHPWEDHYDVGHHTTFYHTPVGHEVGGYHGGGAVHSEALHGGGGGFHGGGAAHGGGGGGHGDGHH
jgi:hypothetical protein